MLDSSLQNSSENEFGNFTEKGRGGSRSAPTMKGIYHKDFKCSWLVVLLFFLSLLNARILIPSAEEGSLPRRPVSSVRDLLEMAENKGIKPLSGEDQIAFFYSFTRGGERRDSLVLIPGALFETDKLQKLDRQCVSLLASMPFNLGDGAILTISMLGDGLESEVFQIQLDPAHKRTQRIWVPIKFSIPDKFHEFRIRFEVQEGSRGDSTGDWVGIAPGQDQECLLAKPFQ